VLRTRFSASRSALPLAAGLVLLAPAAVSGYRGDLSAGLVEPVQPAFRLAASVPLPGKIAGISPEAQGRVGPFVDGKRNLYTVSEVSAADAQMKMMKSTDGGRTWAEVDGAHRPTVEDLEAVWMAWRGTTLQILHQRSGGRVVAHAFNTSDAATNPDSWTLRDEPVATAGDASEQYVSLVVLTTGDMWAFYARATSSGDRVAFRKKPLNGSWGPEALLDSVATGQVVAVRGAKDKTHIFYKDASKNQIKHRSLSATGALSAAQRVDDTGVNSEHSSMTNAVYYDDDGVETVVVAWADPTGRLRSARLLNGVPSQEVAVSAAPVLLDPPLTTNRAAVAHLANYGKAVRAVWSDAATADIFQDVSFDGAAWRTDTEIRDGVTAHWLYATIFTHSAANGGRRVLGYVYDNNTDDDPDTDGIEYNELNLTTMP
jgi:hypothetical protein